MSFYTDGSVYFLEDSDFDSQLRFKHNTQGKPMIVEIMGSFCGHCRKAEPMFREFALKHNNKDAIVATVQMDGSESEKALAKRFSSTIPNFRGVPTFVAFINGKYAGTYNGDRSVAGLESFLTQL